MGSPGLELPCFCIVTPNPKTLLRRSLGAEKGSPICVQFSDLPRKNSSEPKLLPMTLLQSPRLYFPKSIPWSKQRPVHIPWVMQNQKGVWKLAWANSDNRPNVPFRKELCSVALQKGAGRKLPRRSHKPWPCSSYFALRTSRTKRKRVKHPPPKRMSNLVAREIWASC